MGIHHLVGNNEILFIFQIVFLSNDFDPPSTCLVGWFDDLHLFGVFLFQLVDFKPIVVLGRPQLYNSQSLISKNMFGAKRLLTRTTSMI